MDITRLQTDLRALGLYTYGIDGIWGSRSEAAYQDMLALASASGAEDLGEIPPIAWGSKVSEDFRIKVTEFSDALEIDPDWLMTCIAFETAGTFRADVKNMAGSGATGLIQFMPSTARSLGTSTEELEKMSVLEQLDYVYAYFAPYSGRLESVGDVYMAILWPIAIGKPAEYPLWSQSTRPTTYRQNSGLDTNNNGVVTKQEAVARLEDLLDTGRRFHLA